MCISRRCIHSWPERHSIVSQQPLKDSSLSFMPNCISGISMCSRVLCHCTQYLSNWVLVLCYCRLILPPSMLTTDAHKIKGLLCLFLASALVSLIFVIILINQLKSSSIHPQKRGSLDCVLLSQYNLRFCKFGFSSNAEATLRCNSSITLIQAMLMSSWWTERLTEIQFIFNHSA